MQSKYIFSFLIFFSIFACQQNTEKSIASTEISVQEAHQQLEAYIKTKGLSEEELRLDLDPAEKDKMMPISQFEEMKQHIDASAERTMTSRLRIKAETEFEKELNQLMETGASKAEVNKKIENFDKEISEKVKAWSNKEK